MVTIYRFETEQACSIAFESGEGRGGGQTHPILFLNVNIRKLDATCLQENTRLNLKMSWFEFFSPRRGVSDSSLSFCMVSLYYPKMTDYDYQSVPGANSLAAAGNI